jgi:penicillin-binding protein 1A
MSQDVASESLEPIEADALVTSKTTLEAEEGVSISMPVFVEGAPEAARVGHAGRARLGRVIDAAAWRLGSAGAFVVAALCSAWSYRAVRVAAPALALALTLPGAVVLSHVYFDRSGLPDLEPFLRFQPPTIGRIYDAQGSVLIELAREYRRVVAYDEMPNILRDAILAAEDKNYFSHSGVDYGALPRVVVKLVKHSWAAWEIDAPFRLVVPQGGSTITQQLVRGYFLRERTRGENGDTLFDDAPAARMLSATLGVSAANKLLRKLEEVRLALWLEAAMERHYGSKELAKREIFARYSSFIYLGNGRYGFAAASEYYFGKPLSSYGLQDVGKAALLAGIGKAPRYYSPVPGDPRPLRRRNEILTLMMQNGRISEDLAKLSQSEPVEVVEPTLVETESPAAVDNVFDELKLHGGEAFGIEELFQGRVSIHSTVHGGVQDIVNEALETGLALYEKRHPRAKGWIQGSVVVLRNADAAILAETGGRSVYNERSARYSDYNRVTSSLRQPGSAMKPFVYLAAFASGMHLDSIVPDEPIEVPRGLGQEVKSFVNYDRQFRGPISAREALAESRNVVAVRIALEVGMGNVLKTARELGIRTPLEPNVATALGASEVRLLELADAYRAMASGIRAQPHVIDRIVDGSGTVLYEAPRPGPEIHSAELSLIQEGLRGVVRLPNGTAHRLAARSFPISVMGKTGTTSDFRDALFVGSTYGPQGITVAVRIGFDDNRSLGVRETGGRVALPIFREVMLRVYQDQLAGPAPKFPREIENRIDAYLALRAQEASQRAQEPSRGLEVN